MIRRVLMTFLAGMMLATSAAASPAMAADASDLKPLCQRVGHGCGSVVDRSDARIIGRHYGHNIGATLDSGDVKRILALADKALAARRAKAAGASDLKPLCDAVDHSCGSTVGPKDARMIGRHYGHSIGATLDSGDVKRILALAEKVRAAQQSQTRRASVWDSLAQCESGGDWGSTVGLYEGGLQFHPGTWDAYKYSGYPSAAYQASRDQQIAVAERVLDAQGWGAWPACSRKLGLR